MTLTEILEKIPGTHIAVVGDAMVDHYEFGRVERICPEAPVPVFIPERNENRPGGAANVASQLIQLGCQVYQSFAPDFCIKTRYISETRHLVLRVDIDKVAHPREDDVRGVAKYIETVKRLDAVILSDYAKGWLSDAMCLAVIGVANARRTPVIVDPKTDDWMKFGGCDLICPSTNEIAMDYNGEAFPNILWKRGAQGMTLVTRGAVNKDIPSVAKRLYDVTGAGDTVVAVVAAAIAVGASKLEAATLAALAAGWVVGEVGTTVCPIEKLRELVNACN